MFTELKCLFRLCKSVYLCQSVCGYVQFVCESDQRFSDNNQYIERLLLLLLLIIEGVGVTNNIIFNGNNISFKS